MKTASIFYFSGTGNTWWASEQIAKGLNARGFNTSAFSIEQVSAKEEIRLIAGSDMIGLGFPIYGSDVPRIFNDFIKKLPVLKQKKDTLGFVTQMAWSGDGCNFLKQYLEKKGYALKWAVEFNMPNNIALPIFSLPCSGDYEKFERALKKCSAKAEFVCEKIAAGERFRQHADLFSAASAWIQRGPFRMVHDWGRRLWSVDEKECIACERCARICSAGNIAIVNGIPEYKEKCVYCMRCFNYCPTLAIEYAGVSNRRVKCNPPFQGPVKEFKPELIIKQR